MNSNNLVFSPDSDSKYIKNIFESKTAYECYWNIFTVSEIYDIEKEYVMYTLQLLLSNDKGNKLSSFLNTLISDEAYTSLNPGKIVHCFYTQYDKKEDTITVKLHKAPILLQAEEGDTTLDTYEPVTNNQKNRLNKRMIECNVDLNV